MCSLVFFLYVLPFTHLSIVLYIEVFMDKFPQDIIREIGLQLCKQNTFRDVCDVAQDAASLYAASKTCTWVKVMAHTMLTHVFKERCVGGFDEGIVYDQIYDKPLGIKDLKELCLRLNLPTSGTKATLLNRIEQRRERRMRLLLDDKVIHELEALRYKVCSAQVAKDVYGLTGKDLQHLEFARKGRYKVREVREVSLTKFASEQALLAFVKQRNTERRAKHQRRVSDLNFLRQLMLL